MFSPCGSARHETELNQRLPPCSFNKWRYLICVTIYLEYTKPSGSVFFNIGVHVSHPSVVLYSRLFSPGPLAITIAVPASQACTPRKSNVPPSLAPSATQPSSALRSNSVTLQIAQNYRPEAHTRIMPPSQLPLFQQQKTQYPLGGNPRRVYFRPPAGI
jgi:hypothetical protein